MILNKSNKSPHSNTIIKKIKLYTYKSPEYKNKESFTDIKHLKKEIYKIINSRLLNKTYHTENSKKKNKEDNINIDKIKDLLLINESFNETECPEPMPYVKKYSDKSDFIDKENLSNSSMNIINNFNKDLYEPKEEKNVPLPISKIQIKSINFTSNRKFIYVNSKKYIKNFI